MIWPMFNGEHWAIHTETPVIVLLLPQSEYIYTRNYLPPNGSGLRTKLSGTPSGEINTVSFSALVANGSGNV